MQSNKGRTLTNGVQKTGSQMKVGIVTFHYAYNHGAVLQCLALYRTVQRMGFDVDVINYVPPDFFKYENSLLRGWGIKRGLLFKNIPKKIIKARYGKAMRRAFDQFRAKYLSFSPFFQRPDGIEEIVKIYDFLIAGSDQVWRFSADGIRFLSVGKSFKGKKISYAPCCGFSDQPHRFFPMIKQWISEFDALSVRNAFSQKLICEVSGRDAEIVADPTLLIDLSDVACRPEKLKVENYILMYMLSDEIQGGHQIVLDSIRNRFGTLPVVAVVSSAHKPQRFPWADQVLYDAGPSEWLYLIRNATFVYTDSFHGALFSIQSDRPFLAYYTEKDRAPRLLDLAVRYELEGFIAGDAEEASEKIQHGSFSFESVNQKIDQHVAESIDYLLRALAL
jgi:hypothetical protein